MKVAAVVVTYNRKELLRECLQALLNQTRPLDEIIVVDNASTDGTDQMIPEEFPQITHVRLPENIGGAGGFHEGMKLAYEKGHDWIWVMDDDAIAEHDSVEKLSIVIAGLGDQADKSCLWSQIVDGEKADSTSDKVILKPVESAMFVGFAVSSKLIERVGLPRTDFFIYYDDDEYCSRIRRADGVILKVLGSVIHHKDWAHQAAIERKILYRTIRTPQIPKWKFYYLSRNDILRSSYNIKSKLRALLRSTKLWARVLLTQPDSIGLLTLGIFHGAIGISGKRVDPQKVR